MDELYDLIRQDYRELYDEIPNDLDNEIADQPWERTSLLGPQTRRLVSGNWTILPIQQTVS